MSRVARRERLQREQFVEEAKATARRALELADKVLGPVRKVVTSHTGSFEAELDETEKHRVP